LKVWSASGEPEKKIEFTHLRKRQLVDYQEAEEKRKNYEIRSITQTTLEETKIRVGHDRGMRKGHGIF